VPFDFEVEPGLTIGTWLYRELERQGYMETDGWAGECVRRVTERLQQGRAPEQRLETVVLWIPEPSAFTGPGRYLYFSRSLLERCPDDETVAFVIAHELAHHDLGHVNLFPRWLAGATRIPGGWIGPVIYHGLERRLYGAERECEADRHGLELCIRAGYAPDRCLHALELLEQLVLDLGDTDGVFGPDTGSGPETADGASWLARARIWTWQRARGYLPLRDRQAMLRDDLARRQATAPVRDEGHALAA
jgi:hypothetical protein